MKKVLLAIAGLGFATAVYAQCTTQTITMPDGKMMICTTCCYYGNCNTFCN